MSGIKVYSTLEMRDMGLRREDLQKQKGNNYDGMSQRKKLASQVELNFLETLLKVQGRNYNN